jgi:hypothetical protein
MERIQKSGDCESGRNGLSLKNFDPAILRLVAEVGVNFFRFMRHHGISHNSNLVVLSPKDDWSYNKDEIGRARILVNLRELNLIKHLDLFLGALVRRLPPDTSFVGCFSGRKGYEVFHRSIRRLFRSTARRWHSINRAEVLELLEKNGFRTINMTDINGRTYFISTNTAQAV